MISLTPLPAPPRGRAFDIRVLIFNFQFSTFNFQQNPLTLNP